MQEAVQLQHVVQEHMLHKLPTLKEVVSPNLWQT